MNAQRIREISLELNELALDREAADQRRRERERELLQELVQITTESAS
jgi:hypothetical protein